MKAIDIKILTFLLTIMLFATDNCTAQLFSKQKEKKIKKDSVLFYRNAAKEYYLSGNLNKSREMYTKFLEFKEPEKLSDVILRKRLFFVSDTFETPQILKNEYFTLKPLKAEHAELDYKAVTSSTEHLTGVLGRNDWPGNLTLDEDRRVLAMHETEFINRTGFVYAVFNEDETEIIGCLYIYPSRIDSYNAEVVMWVTKSEFDKGADEKLFNLVKSWLNTEWPFMRIIYPGREISWAYFFNQLDKQDQKYTQ